MPELPEVETVRLGLEKFFSKGAHIKQGAITRPNLRFPFPNDFINNLKGAKISRFARHGKYLLLFLDNNFVWLIHLGMSGQIQLRDSPIEMTRHHHLKLQFETKTGLAKYLYYYDPRRFGFMDMFPQDALDDNRFLKKLGTDPINDRLDARQLLAQAKGKNTHIKSFLMNQYPIAGLGNIYCNEILWQAKIHPARRAASLTQKDWKNLVDSIEKILKHAIKLGGSSMSDFVHPDGKLGYFHAIWQVYNKEGESCRHCQATLIARLKQSNRASYFCMNCQT